MRMVEGGAVVGGQSDRGDARLALPRPRQPPGGEAAALEVPARAGGLQRARTEQEVLVELSENLAGGRVEQADGLLERGLLAAPGDLAGVGTVAQVAEVADEGFQGSGRDTVPAGAHGAHDRSFRLMARAMWSRTGLSWRSTSPCTAPGGCSRRAGTPSRRSRHA